MITEDKIIEDIKYLFSKINWSASFLDAKAINIMNILCAEVGRIKQEERQRLKKLLNDGGKIYLNAPNLDILAENAGFGEKTEIHTNSVYKYGNQTL